MRAPSFASRPTLALISILGSGIAVPSLAAQSYVAPTNETITTRVEEGFGSTPSQVIWVQNGSTVGIDVYSVTLRQCENVKQECAPRPLRLHLAPGRSEVLERVEPRDPERGFSYRYGFGWRADSAGLAALRVLAGGGSAEAQQRLAAQQRAADEERTTVGAHDVVLRRDDLVQLGPQIVRLGVEPDSVVLHVGQSFLMHQVRVLAYDLQGNVLGRVGAYQWRFPQALIAVHSDTVTALRPGRTQLSFHLPPPAPDLSTALKVIIAPADSTQ